MDVAQLFPSLTALEIHGRAAVRFTYSIQGYPNVLKLWVSHWNERSWNREAFFSQFPILYELDYHVDVIRCDFSPNFFLGLVKALPKSLKILGIGPISLSCVDLLLERIDLDVLIIHRLSGPQISSYRTYFSSPRRNLRKVRIAGQWICLNVL
jgi:hypothetical protein